MQNPATMPFPGLTCTPPHRHNELVATQYITGSGLSGKPLRPAGQAHPVRLTVFGMTDADHIRRALAAVYVRSAGVVSRRVAGEAVLVPITTRPGDTQCIYTMNEVASFVWERIDGRHRGMDIVEAVLEEFDIERERVEREVVAFLGQLSHSGAIEVAA